MIYCDKIEDYVDQNEKCINCIFYKKQKDICDYDKWHPGLKQKNDNRDN